MKKACVVIEGPLPPGCMQTVYGDDERFVQTYWSTFSQFEPPQQVYSTFDWGIRDADGYYFILGRTDDVINVAGHRLGTREIEESISSHPNVSEVAVVGVAGPAQGTGGGGVRDPEKCGRQRRRAEARAGAGSRNHGGGGQAARRTGTAGARAFRQRAAEDAFRQAAAALDPGACAKAAIRAT